jgi:hypothetical protein
MSTDEALDADLRRDLDAPDLPDDGFTAAVVEGIHRFRRRRRLAVSGAAGLGLLVVVGGIAAPPAGAGASLALTPAGIVATVFLAAVCSLIWIEEV